MEYTRSTPPRLVDSIFRPIFLRSVPERKPRTEWACQPVAFISSAKVAPLDFSRRAMTMGSLAALAVRGGLRLGAAFRLLFAPAGLGFRGRGTWLSGRSTRFTRFCRLGS